MKLHCSGVRKGDKQKNEEVGGYKPMSAAPQLQNARRVEVHQHKTCFLSFQLRFKEISKIFSQFSISNFQNLDICNNESIFLNDITFLV